MGALCKYTCVRYVFACVLTKGKYTHTHTHMGVCANAKIALAVRFDDCCTSTLTGSKADRQDDNTMFELFVLDLLLILKVQVIL